MISSLQRSGDYYLFHLAPPEGICLGTGRSFLSTECCDLFFSYKALPINDIEPRFQKAGQVRRQSSISMLQQISP